jgi:lipopolysaccharide assembly outer membrane protein LptD (OstA)
MIKPSFDVIYMELAQKLAERSHCVKMHVGAVLTKDTRIVSLGYNGPPAGTHNCDIEWPIEGCPRDSKGSCSLALHAEQNAILYASKNNVSVENPKYNIESQELKYNIRTKVVQFLSESIIITDNNTINTRSGTYNSKTGEANFTSRTSVENEDQFIEGNTLKYYESNGKAIARGKVIVIDQKENTQLNADYVEYIKKSDLGKAIGHVVIVDAKNQTQIV